MDIFHSRSLPFLTRRNYIFEMLHLLPWSILSALIEGQFGAIVVAESFKGTDYQVSIATSTPIAALTFSMFWGFLVRGRSKIRMYVLLSCGVVGMALTIALTPLGQAGAYLFIAQMAVAQILLAGVVTVRSAMWKSNYPHLARGRIASRLQAVRETVLMMAALVAAEVLHARPDFVTWIYPLACVFGVVGILLISRIRVRGEAAELRALARPAERAGASHTPSGDHPRTPPAPQDHRILPAGMSTAAQAMSPTYLLRNSIRILRRDKRFAEYILAQLLLGISNQLPMALVIVLVAEQLAGLWEPADAAYRLPTILIIIIPKFLLLASITRWGPLFDRLGVVRFRIINSFCWITALSFGMAGTLCLLNASWIGESAWLWATLGFALRGVFQGLGMGGGKLAWNLGHLHFAKHDEAEAYMGIHMSLTGLRGLIAPATGVWLWGIIGWYVWVVALALAVIGLALFMRLARREKQAQETATADGLN